MNRVDQPLWWLWVGALLMPQWTQGADLGSLSVDQQRQGIAAMRVEKMADLDAQDALCASRFATNDCRQAVATSRRAVLRDLRQQEYKLNELERQNRGTQQLERLKLKDRDSAGMTPQPRRKDREIPSAAVPNRSPASRSSRAIESPLSPAEVEKNRNAFADKQRAAQARKQARDKRLQDKNQAASALPKAP